MISKWMAKALVQKTISFFPKKEKINHLFQKHVTKGVYLTDQYFENKITHASDHIKYFLQHSQRRPEQTEVLELGTGWYPIIPIALFLNDFKSVISIDIMSWMNSESQLTTVKMFEQWRQQGKLAKYLPYINEEKWKQMMDLLKPGQVLEKEEISARLGFTSLLEDATKTSFDTNSIDFICSNNTFEHIPKVVLKGILKEFGRIAKQDGLMSHFIDLSDHFAHYDKKINIYNFLKYSESQWKLIDNDIQPQNRMRWPAYLELYKDLQIPVTEQHTRAGDVDLVRTVTLAKQYQNYTPQELAISHGYIVSKMGQ